MTPASPRSSADSVDEKTKLVFGETIGNPAINVMNLDAWSDAAHAQGLPFIVDNTATTPSQGLRAAWRIRARGHEVHGGHGTVDRRHHRRLHGFYRTGRLAERFLGLTQPDGAYHGVI